MRQGYWSVAAIFEDRHDVVVLGAGGQLLRMSVPVKRTQVRHVAPSTAQRCSCVQQALNWLVCSPFSVSNHARQVLHAGGRVECGTRIGESEPSLRRMQELDDLKGWRRAVSILLEFGDIATPLLRSLASRLGAAVSWLLVTLIGRSLGLVFRGVRESFGGRSGRQRGKDAPRRRSAAAQGV